MGALDRAICDAGPTADFHDESCPRWCAYGHPDNVHPIPYSAKATSVYDERQHCTTCTCFQPEEPQ